MNADAWVNQLTAPLAIVLGIVFCFLGYRILKLTLGVIGFTAGAVVGWEFGLSLTTSTSVFGFVGAMLGGVIGAFLCVWLFFFGIFLLGASAGIIFTSAFLSATGHQPHPILLIACAILFGVVALLIQKLMIILSTAFSGSYLVVAGILHLVTGTQSHLPLWFDPSHLGTAGMQDFIVLGGWLVLGLAGVAVQYSGSRKKEEVTRHETQPT